MHFSKLSAEYVLDEIERIVCNFINIELYIYRSIFGAECVILHIEHSLFIGNCSVRCMYWFYYSIV